MFSLLLEVQHQQKFRRAPYWSRLCIHINKGVINTLDFSFRNRTPYFPIQGVGAGTFARGVNEKGVIRTKSMNHCTWSLCLVKGLGPAPAIHSCRPWNEIVPGVKAVPPWHGPSSRDPSPAGKRGCDIDVYTVVIKRNASTTVLSSQVVVGGLLNCVCAGQNPPPAWESGCLVRCQPRKSKNDDNRDH